MARSVIRRLDTETWGERLHRAYRTARAEAGSRNPATGEAAFSYRMVADKLRSVGIDVSDQALLRLEEQVDVPRSMRQRQVAYFTLIAYGFDPAEFGLTPDNVILSAFDLPKIKRALAPTFRWSSRVTPTLGRGVSAGQAPFLDAA